MKVVKIEPAGRADVYNMEVPGPHSFVVANGIVAHNCYDEARYMLMEYKIKAIETRDTVQKPWNPLEYDEKPAHVPRFW